MQGDPRAYLWDVREAAQAIQDSLPPLLACVQALLDELGDA